jgi:hypothetical protein
MNYGRGAFAMAPDNGKDAEVRGSCNLDGQTR